jgi:hypothetical protein
MIRFRGYYLGLEVCNEHGERGSGARRRGSRVVDVVLELKAPEDPKLTAILSLWPTMASYVVSYAFIAII